MRLSTLPVVPAVLLVSLTAASCESARPALLVSADDRCTGEIVSTDHAKLMASAVHVVDGLVGQAVPSGPGVVTLSTAVSGEFVDAGLGQLNRLGISAKPSASQAERSGAPNRCWPRRFVRTEKPREPRGTLPFWEWFRRSFPNAKGLLAADEPITLDNEARRIAIPVVFTCGNLCGSFWMVVIDEPHGQKPNIQPHLILRF